MRMRATDLLPFALGPIAFCAQAHAIISQGPQTVVSQLGCLQRAGAEGRVRQTSASAFHTDKKC